MTPLLPLFSDRDEAAASALQLLLREAGQSKLGARLKMGSKSLPEALAVFKQKEEIEKIQNDLRDEFANASNQLNGDAKAKDAIGKLRNEFETLLNNLLKE